MGRPPSDLDDYLDWQERLESHKASGLPIITASALLKLAEWWESHVNLAQGERHVRTRKSVCPPPRPAAKGVIPLGQLWTQLAPERRQQALRILACVVARQLVPLPGKEADDARCRDHLRSL